MSDTSLTGLDIGSTSIRVADMSRVRGAAVLNHFGKTPLAPGIVQAGIISDETAVTLTLRQMWAEHKFRNKSVVLGVSNQQVVVRPITMPDLPPAELKAALPFRVRDILALPVEKAILDFCPLGRAEDGEGIRGLMVAAPRQGVLSAVRAVEAAGLRVVAVDLAAFAVLRAAGRIGVGTEAIIDIGSHATNLVVHTDGSPQMVRTIPRGGAEITETIATRLRISVAAAEQLKCRVGLAPSTLEALAEHPELNPTDLRDTVADAVRPMVGEIRSSLAYFNSAEEHAVVRLALCGGGALLPGLTDLLQRELAVETAIANPLDRIRDSREGGRHDMLDHFKAAATVCIGLTLGQSA